MRTPLHVITEQRLRLIALTHVAARREQADMEAQQEAQRQEEIRRLRAGG